MDSSILLGEQVNANVTNQFAVSDAKLLHQVLVLQSNTGRFTMVIAMARVIHSSGLYLELHFLQQTRRLRVVIVPIVEMRKDYMHVVLAIKPSVYHHRPTERHTDECVSDVPQISTCNGDVYVIAGPWRLFLRGPLQLLELLVPSLESFLRLRQLESNWGCNSSHRNKEVVFCREMVCKS